MPGNKACDFRKLVHQVWKKLMLKTISGERSVTSREENLCKPAFLNRCALKGSQ
ncbi:hypothetical protein SK128_005216, partial [Halocaridina rubra]